MKINIYGSTGIIGSKTLLIVKKYFPHININLLCANNNVNKLIKQSHIFKPKYIFIYNNDNIDTLKQNAYSKSKILNFKDLQNYLSNSKSDYSLLAISGYKSLIYFDKILRNSSSLGIVSKEAIVSGGHLFNKLTKKNKKKIFPIDSEHFSIFHYLSNSNSIDQIKNITLTASGGPFLGKKYSSLKNVSFSEAINHPKWKMGYKNSIDSATLSNKCLELIEAHYLFDIPFTNLKILVHPESIIHSVIQNKNYIYNMIAFQNDMKIPIYHFLNKEYNYEINAKQFALIDNLSLNFLPVNKYEFPIYDLFNQLKKNPVNFIKFNVGNEFAVNLFRKNIIKYTDIFNIIEKICSLNLNYKLNTIKDVLEYHEVLEKKIYEKYNTLF